jgi:hypothetical protein
VYMVLVYVCSRFIPYVGLQNEVLYKLMAKASLQAMWDNPHMLSNKLISNAAADKVLNLLYLYYSKDW